MTQIATRRRRLKPPTGEAVLITWLAKTSDPYVRQRPTFHAYVERKGERIRGPLLEAVWHAASPLRGHLSTVYICWRDTQEASDEITDGKVLRETLDELRRQGPGCPALKPIPWKTDASPTDHDALLTFAKSAIQQVRDTHPDAHIYVHTSPGTTAMSNVWVVLGATAFIPGQFTLLQGIPERFRKRRDSPLLPIGLQLETWLRRYRGSRPSTTSSEDDGTLLEPAEIKSPALLATLEALDRWAPLRVPLLLLGERGTGKTSLANYLRSRGPFQACGTNEWPVAVCGQFRVEVSMARSELFGHARGAFTGAISEREGLLKKANGDCLLLDEIGDIDQGTQRLLVAAIEGRGFRPVGGDAVEHSQFRLICATNRTMEELGSELLDPDFFDRIGYAVVKVPPLRDCRDDLPWYWRRVLRRATHQAGLQLAASTELESETRILELLTKHPLPGNLRDLYRLAYHLLAALQGTLSSTDPVSEALHSFREQEQRRQHKDTLLPAYDDLRSALPLEKGALKRMEKDFRSRWVQAAMAASGGNISQAARSLGVPRKTLDQWVQGARAEEG